MKKTMEKVLTGMYAAVVILLSYATPVLATTNEYAKKGATWLLDGIFWIVLVGGIWGGYKLLKNSNIVQGIIVFASTAIVCVLCKDPLILENAGNTIKGVVGL